MTIKWARNEVFCRRPAPYICGRTDAEERFAGRCISLVKNTLARLRKANAELKFFPAANFSFSNWCFSRSNP